MSVLLSGFFMIFNLNNKILQSQFGKREIVWFSALVLAVFALILFFSAVLIRRLSRRKPPGEDFQEPSDDEFKIEKYG